MESDYVDLDCVCDIAPSLVESFSEKLWVPWYTDIDLMLHERKIDIAIIAVPHKSYIDILQKVASKKIHIIKEKPLGINLDEAKKFKI